MTMPHLSNCPHNSEGWCLECVKQLWEEKESLIAKVNSLDWELDDVYRQLAYTE